jgi:ABC-type ATPase involved in cell division
MIGVINLEKELILNRCVSKTAVCLGIIAEEAIHLRKEAVQLCILLTLWEKIKPQSSDMRGGEKQ